jgi:hypothetical protein
MGPIYGKYRKFTSRTTVTALIDIKLMAAEMDTLVMPVIITPPKWTIRHSRVPNYFLTVAFEASA